MTDIKNFVLGFNIDDYIQWLETLVNMSPVLEPDEDLEKAYKVWNDCVLFWEKFGRNAPMSNDQKKELDKATMLIRRKTYDNELLSLRSEGVYPIEKNDFEMVKRQINELTEMEKAKLERSLNKGIDKGIVYGSRLNRALEQINPAKFIRDGVLIPIEKGHGRDSVKMIVEISAAQWILKQSTDTTEEAKPKTSLKPLRWVTSKWKEANNKQIYLLFVALKENGFFDGENGGSDEAIAEWIKAMFGLKGKVTTITTEMSRIREGLGDELQKTPYQRHIILKIVELLTEMEKKPYK